MAVFRVVCGLIFTAVLGSAKVWFLLGASDGSGFEWLVCGIAMP